MNAVAESLEAIAQAPEHAKRKRKTKSPNARTLEALRKAGWAFVDVVEQRIPHCMITRDLWGCIDILAIGDQGVMAVQATSCSGGNFAARVRKVAESSSLPLMLKWGFKVQVWGWKKRAGEWVVRIHEF